MKPGWGDLAKALDPGGKPPQGRARDSVVLSIRPPSWPVCVYMYGRNAATNEQGQPGASRRKKPEES